MQGTLNDVAQLEGTLSGVATINGTMSGVATLSANLTIPDVVSPPAYTGSYTVTASAETQTLETNGLVMSEDITINPIPNNYGLITWNGSYLTVS